MTTTRFRFGIFEFDAGARELRRDGRPVRLQSQPAQLLAFLLEHAGEVVSRDDLRNTIWGTETFVDFERGLNFCIAQVRSALDDDATSPRFIRTIPKRGYQFIAPVQRLNDSMAKSETSTISRRSTVSKAAWASGVLLLLALSALGGYWARSLAMAKRQPIVAVVRFDNETADATMTRFADGLTDNVVEELTRMSRGRYAVVGNARILRLPRDQRDLNAIGASLHAAYIVLGQVQSDGAQTRVLAHLIRLPEQSHLWVARIESATPNPLDAESSAAQKVGDQFSWRIISDSSGARLPALPNR
jgi:DNA-binding winged helix-turn-helix (wHTH) protein/TolB-like protein